MPPTFIFLIPEDYFGPVFVFFERSDGVDMQPDPSGHSVTVPANGIVKIRAPLKEVSGSGAEGKPAAYYFSVSRDGVRRKMKVFVGTYQDTKHDRWYSEYIFEDNTIRKFFFSDDESGEYKFFSNAVKSERMIFGRDACDDNFNDLEDKPGGPYCGQFFVASPNEVMALPERAWEDFYGRRNSIQEAIDEGNQRLKEGTSLIPKQASQKPDTC